MLVHLRNSEACTNIPLIPQALCILLPRSEKILWLSFDHLQGSARNVTSSGLTLPPNTGWVSLVCAYSNSNYSIRAFFYYSIVTVFPAIW